MWHGQWETAVCIAGHGTANRGGNGHGQVINYSRSYDKADNTNKMPYNANNKPYNTNDKPHNTNTMPYD